MAKYRIIGVEHKEGTSKKTGRPYDMDFLYVASCGPSRNPNLVGNTVDTIPISRDSGILLTTPVPGDFYEISFNRAGYVEEAYAVE